MSDAISLFSALAGLKPAGQAARSVAVSGFETLFLQGGTGSSGEDAGAEAQAEAAGAALKDMYTALTGVARKAAYLGQAGDDAGKTLEEVAELSSDLAEALAEFDDKTGLGLVQMRKAGLPGQDGAIAVPEATGETAPDAATETAEALADPAAAVQALQSAIATVAGALRGISATATMPSPTAAGLSVAPQVGAPVVAAETAPAAMAIPAAATMVTGDPAAADMATSAAAGSSPASAAETVAERAAETVAGPDAARLFPPAEGARSDHGAGRAGKALLSQIVAAAGEASQSAAAPQAGAAATFTAGGVAELETGRSGAAEALITPEDIARALARDGQAGRDPAIAATQTQAAQSGAEQPRFAAALADQIRSAEVSEGRTRIELTPRGLGQIEVDVTTRDDGTLQVVVRAENPAVLNSLREERELLAQVLGGLDAGSLDLQSFSDGGGQEPQSDRGPVLTGPGGEDTAGAAAAPAAPAQTATIGAGRLDIVT